MRWRVGITAVCAALTWLPACGLQQPCACGRSFETDPFTETDYVVGVGHSTAVHCACRCGDGPTVLEDPSARCDLYEGDCTTPDGALAEYRCE